VAKRRKRKEKAAKKPAKARKKRAKYRKEELESRQEAFDAQLLSEGRMEARKEEADEAGIHPIEVQPVAIDKPEKEDVPSFATAALAGIAIGMITFAFFAFFMKFEPLYAAAVAIPVCLAFAIAINGVLEEKKRN
jgi:hypothetical protein